MYIYVCSTYVCMYICLCVCMYLCMYVRMCVCMYACMYVYMYVCMYVCVYVCMHVCMYVRILLKPIQLYFGRTSQFYWHFTVTCDFCGVDLSLFLWLFYFYSYRNRQFFYFPILFECGVCAWDFKLLPFSIWVMVVMVHLKYCVEMLGDS